MSLRCSWQQGQRTRVLVMATAIIAVIDQITDDKKGRIEGGEIVARMIVDTIKAE